MLHGSRGVDKPFEIHNGSGAKHHSFQQSHRDEQN